MVAAEYNNNMAALGTGWQALRNRNECLRRAQRPRAMEEENGLFTFILRRRLLRDSEMKKVKTTGYSKPETRYSSSIKNRKSRIENGFVLLLVILAIAVVGIEMFVLTNISGTMQFQSHTVYLQACERNLMASGLAWARQNIRNKSGQTSGGKIELDVSEMNILNSALDVTINMPSDREAEFFISSSCSRGRQTRKGGNTFRIDLNDKQETTLRARESTAGN